MPPESTLPYNAAKCKTAHSASSETLCPVSPSQPGSHAADAPEADKTISFHGHMHTHFPAVSPAQDVRYHRLLRDTALCAENSTSDEKKAAEEAAYNKASELIKKLNEGADFETLAKENSEDTGSASNGGLITGVNKAGYDADFYAAALALKDGEYTKTPVKSQFGYHIIYTVSRTEAESYDTLKDSLYDKVVDQKISNDSYLTYKTWDEIRKKYNLNITDTSLKTSYESTINNINKQ